MNKFVTDYTLEELLKLEYSKPEKPYNAFVIVPTGEQHDSGWMCAKFILLYDREIVGVIGGGSDAVHLNGIGGYGKDINNLIADKVERVSWCIDILPKSGCVRVFCTSHWLEIDPMVLSDFVIFAKEKFKYGRTE